MANQGFDALQLLGASNWRVRVLRQLQHRKYREGSSFTLLEGLRLIETACAAGARLETLVVTERMAPQWTTHLQPLVDRGAAEVFRASEQVMQRVSASVTPPGILGVVRVPRQELPQPPFSPDLTLLCLDGVADPGNAGTLIRTADAAGAAGIFGFGGVDLWGPKTLRAAMGSSFHLPTVELADGSGLDLLADLRAAGCRVVCASPHAQDLIWEADLTGPCVLILGNEAWGPSREALRLADLSLAIPLLGRAESLNVAQAGGVILFEIARQKYFARETCQLS